MSVFFSIGLVEIAIWAVVRLPSFGVAPSGSMAGPMTLVSGKKDNINRIRRLLERKRHFCCFRAEVNCSVDSVGFCGLPSTIIVKNCNGTDQTKKRLKCCQ